MINKFVFGDNAKSEAKGCALQCEFIKNTLMAHDIVKKHSNKDIFNNSFAYDFDAANKTSTIHFNLEEHGLGSHPVTMKVHHTANKVVIDPNDIKVLFGNNLKATQNTLRGDVLDKINELSDAHLKKVKREREAAAERAAHKDKGLNLADIRAEFEAQMDDIKAEINEFAQGIAKEVKEIKGVVAVQSKDIAGLRDTSENLLRIMELAAANVNNNPKPNP